MLTRKEKIIMDFLFLKCAKNGNCLISVQEIMLSVAHQIKFKEESVKEIIFSLQQEGYFDIIYTDRQGESVLVITLLAKGKGYLREKVQDKRQIKFKIVLAFIGAILSFIVGKILYYIFL